MDINLTQLIKNNTATLAFYRSRFVYYTIPFEGFVYQFPVCVDVSDPAYDLGNATLNATEKGMTMLRYLRIAKEQGLLTRTAA